MCQGTTSEAAKKRLRDDFGREGGLHPKAVQHARHKKIPLSIRRGGRKSNIVEALKCALREITNAEWMAFDTSKNIVRAPG
jgi:hypothetical protein